MPDTGRYEYFYMSYELTKILPLIVYPLGLALLLFIAVTLSNIFGGRGKSAVAGLSGILILWVAAMPITTSFVMGSLENDFAYIPADQQQKADAIVVLGGFTINPDTANLGIEINDGIDRLFHGKRLFVAGKAPYMILAGGAPRGHTAESKLMRQLLMELGVPAEAILTEGESRNTYQNARNLIPDLQKHGIDRVLLVTSAFHMRRAQAVFEKFNVNVIPAATDYQVGEPDPSILDWLPDAEALMDTTRGIKEYLGWIVYSLRGWV